MVENTHLNRFKCPLISVKLPMDRKCIRDRQNKGTTSFFIFSKNRQKTAFERRFTLAAMSGIMWARGK
jgi:hypothetical protein